MTTFTQDQWIILALVFVLGLLVGMFLTAGGRKKWKTRYRDEVTRREQIEREHKKHHEEWAAKEKDWHARESHRDTVARDAPRRDLDRDGVPDSRDRRPVDDRRA
jgi:hypothetical protein